MWTGKESIWIFFRGDYKFIFLLLGLSGATSNYACSWCKVHNYERWNMKYDLEYYSCSKLKRTLEDLKKSATKSSKESYCSVKTPLLNIELDHVIPGELHLLLRIMDVLINNLVKDAINWDVSDNWKRKKSEHTNTHLTELKDTILSCCISFDVREKKKC